jgi:hypothetical protein
VVKNKHIYNNTEKTIIKKIRKRTDGVV